MKIIITTTILLLTSTLAPTILAADASAGQQKASTCFGCHGPEGNSNIPPHPNLAGQQANYLVNQLTAFRDNKRTNSIMNGMAKNLSDVDIQDLAAFFSSRKTKSAGGDATLAKEGATKVNQCLGCHNTNAQGKGNFPKLAGQQPVYLAKQLHDFKSGTRKFGPMQAMASSLSESDIAQITAYLASLQ